MRLGVWDNFGSCVGLARLVELYVTLYDTHPPQCKYVAKVKLKLVTGENYSSAYRGYVV